MANFCRLLVGLMFLPACWGVSRTFLDCLIAATGGGTSISFEALALLGGLLAFVVCWIVLSHPIKAYVLAHELTHALWGLVFGARPSNLRVSASGGSVRLTKSNLLITLAPYFFPFYTFVVIAIALITSLFVKPLPCIPLWMFLIGFTWSFHILFTVETLTQRQPDVTLYGRVFSWTLIYVANIAIVLVWLAATTPLTFAELGGFCVQRVWSAYAGVASAVVVACRWAAQQIAGSGRA